jgi:TetR/AcrR family transcriptional regulator, fatty acid metabolism regulator protein
MPIKKVTKRKQRALTTRQLIFETALALFRKKSYDQITIGEICKKAGISTGAFYHHFKSKDQIIAEEYLKLDEFCIETFNKLPRDISALNRLVTFNGIMGRRFAEMGVKHLRAVYYSEIGPKRKKRFLMDERRPIFKILGELVRDAQEKGEIRNDMDCATIVDILVKSTRGNIYDWALRNGDYDFERTGMQILSALLQGLIPREDKKRVPLRAK